MKTIILTMCAFFMFGTVNAQNDYKQQFKNSKQLMELNNDMQKTKADKDARKQAKKMAKEGWKVAPGALPLEKQISRTYLLMNMFEDDLLTPKYVWGEANSVGEFYDAAKMQAQELARIDLLTHLDKEITAIVENSVGNQQLRNNDAASISQTVKTVKSFVTKKLGRTINTIECYKELKNGNYIVRVQVFYSLAEAQEIAKEAIREEMRNKSEQALGNQE